MAEFDVVSVSEQFGEDARDNSYVVTCDIRADENDRTPRQVRVVIPGDEYRGRPADARNNSHFGDMNGAKRKEIIERALRDAGFISGPLHERADEEPRLFVEPENTKPGWKPDVPTEAEADAAAEREERETVRVQRQAEAENKRQAKEVAKATKAANVEASKDADARDLPRSDFGENKGVRVESFPSISEG